MEARWMDTGDTVAEEFLGLTCGVFELIPRPTSLRCSMRLIDADAEEDGEGPLWAIR